MRHITALTFTTLFCWHLVVVSRLWQSQKQFCCQVAIFNGTCDLSNFGSRLHQAVQRWSSVWTKETMKLLDPNKMRSQPTKLTIYTSIYISYILNHLQIDILKVSLQIESWKTVALKVMWDFAATKRFLLKRLRQPDDMDWPCASPNFRTPLRMHKQIP